MGGVASHVVIYFAPKLGRTQLGWRDVQWGEFHNNTLDHPKPLNPKPYPWLGMGQRPWGPPLVNHIELKVNVNPVVSLGGRKPANGVSKLYTVYLNDEPGIVPS